MDRLDPVRLSTVQVDAVLYLLYDRLLLHYQLVSDAFVVNDL